MTALVEPRWLHIASIVLKGLATGILLAVLTACL